MIYSIILFKTHVPYSGEKELVLFNSLVQFIGDDVINNALDGDPTK